MEYVINNKEERDRKYAIGDYVADDETVYQIIYDSSHGYALLDIGDGRVSSRFYDKLETLVANAMLDVLDVVKQKFPVEFEVK